MMQRFALDCLLLLLVPLTTTTAQFACTFSGAKDVSQCTDAIDHGDHCVWCSVGGDEESSTPSSVTDIGFCVSEDQAEKIEETIPSAHCDRYHGNSTADDDSASTDDDYKEPDDDKSPSDDSIPSNYWECLKEKDSKSCAAKEECKWCDTKAGYGVCMAGPAADAESNSAWFTCDSLSENKVDLFSAIALEDPTDPSCLVAFLQDPTAEGCEAALDADGNGCEFCNLQGAFQVCLNAEQAEMGEQFGITCDGVTVQDPADPACLVAYLQDPTAEGCAAAVDADGKKCEFCTLQGAFEVCLNEEQAEMGEQFGITCDEVAPASKVQNLLDPADPSCLVAFLQDPTAEGCAAAVDADGNACEFCSLQGAFQVCLNGEQAAMGEQFGITCDANIATTSMTLQDPADPSCLVAYLQDPTAEGCAAAVDADGKACEFCNLQGAFQICLNEDQAEIGEQFGLSCDEDASSLKDPADPSCLVAYLQDPTSDGCAAAVDADGNQCEFCNLQGAFQICLNVDQAEMGEQFGLSCDETVSSVQDPADPSCLVAYLQDPTSDGCTAAVDADGKACEFCNLQGAFQICLNEDQAEMGEQFGLTCDETSPSATMVQDPADPSCLVAYLQDPTAEGCAAAVDADGKACEFCNLQGAFQICLNEDQAEMGEQFGLTCDETSPSAASVMVEDPADPSCLVAYLQDPTADGCAAAVDADGNQCEFCTLQGAFQVCLNEEQAAMGEQFGVTCDAEDTRAVDSPLDDLFDCLEHYVEDDCYHSSSCTWCNTQVGMGFCVTPELAEATKQISFFDCEFASLLTATA